ncbi:MAG: hypothetical protein U9O53_05685, partial [archaeon]|nr:hypothetical protein [archaeon]
PGHEKKNESQENGNHETGTENTSEKTDLKSENTEHIMAPKKTDMTAATNEDVAPKEENTLPETDKTTDKTEQIPKAEDNDLEKLINLFEQEAGKARKSHEPVKLPNESMTSEPIKPSKK